MEKSECIWKLRKKTKERGEKMSFGRAERGHIHISKGIRRKSILIRKVVYIFYIPGIILDVSSRMYLISVN